FAPEGTQRYYTSLLLHAISPRQSIDSLFNILFDFYIKNLDFQYVAEDISYRMFTKGMRARWDSRVKKNEDLQLRSDAVFSGLQALFQARPGYMAMHCDSIVKKMDALLRGEAENVMDPERNYWDHLLLEWFNKKSATERVRAQGERRQRKTEYVATTSERIYVQYAMDRNLVGLSLPKIRLPKVGELRPIIRVFQQENLIFQDELTVTGNDLCLTTKSRF
ncbi:Chaperone protein DnaJ, partial [Dysosmobacter welbionis]